LNLGLAFQIADDILDICGTSEQIGKTAGKDAKAAKCTYPAMVGIEKAKEIEKQYAEKAVDSLNDFKSAGEILRQLPIELLKRIK
jgi:geranylgeranyl diphosphate synthase type II